MKTFVTSTFKYSVGDPRQKKRTDSLVVFCNCPASSVISKEHQLKRDGQLTGSSLYSTLQRIIHQDFKFADKHNGRC